jgi:hypothetical protein
MPTRARQSSSWHEQNHIDIGALSERVDGLASSIGDIRDTLASINKRIEAKPTDTWKIVGGVGVLLTLGGGFLFQSLAPLNAEIARHDREIGRVADTALTRDDYRREHDEFVSWVSSLRDRQRADEDTVAATRIEMAKLEGATDERHAEYLRDHEETQARISTLDGNQIKRPEIEAQNAAVRELITLLTNGTGARIDAVIASLNELRHDFGNNFTIGDVIKDIQDRLNSMPTPSAK